MSSGSLAKVPIKKLFVPNYLHVEMKKFDNTRDEARYKIAMVYGVKPFGRKLPNGNEENWYNFSIIALCELDGFTDLFYRPTYVEWSENATCPYCEKAIVLRRLEGRELPR